MLAVHAFWSGDHLCLWSEDSEAETNSPSQALKKARPHPFAVPAEALREVLGLEAEQTVAGSTDLQLPSRRRSPLDSPELVRLTPRRASKEEPRLLSGRSMNEHAVIYDTRTEPGDDVGTPGRIL